jgi:subtilisin family serine protease
MSPGVRVRPARVAALLLAALMLAAPVSPASAGDEPDSASAALSWPPAADLAPHRPGEVILKFREAAPPDARQRILAELGAARTRKLHRIRAERSPVTRMSVADAVARFRGHPDIDFIEPNYLYREARQPDDPMFGLQWSLSNDGQTGGRPGADIEAPAAWEQVTGDGDIVVAVIDTGIDLLHPDLAANIWVNPGEIPANGYDEDGNGLVDDLHGWDFLENDADPFDDRGHGTHVAGILAAVGDNGVGISGVAWRVRLMPLKFLGADGVGSSADAVECVDYATRMGATVINASWGGGGYSEALRRAIARAADEGVLFVAAAGNLARDNDVEPFYPASYDLPNVISVAATDHDDLLAPFSNFGAASVDLAAPGAAILGTLPNEEYGYLSGTSMAAPHVSGVLALMLDRHHRLDTEGARLLLLDRVDPLATLSGAVLSGGRLDARNAVEGSDDMPPAPVTDLHVLDPDGERVDLVWTASGDDGDAGTARRYDLRVSTQPIDEASFELADRLPDAPRPAPAGSTERMTVGGLDHETEYHFALRVIDELGNRSPLSNDAAGTTLGPPVLSLAPDRLRAELQTGGQRALELALANTGAGEASFDLLVEGPSRLAADGTADDAVELLVLGSGTGSDRLRTHLGFLPGIARVDAIEIGSAMPTLELLLAYDAVLVTFKLPPPDPVGLGDLLADYADTGSGLIVTLAAPVHGWELAGRLLHDGYLPFELGTGPGGASELGQHDATHPLMNGVSQLVGDELARLDPAPGASLVASWADGQPLLVTLGGNIVGINVFFDDGAGWDGDFPRLVRNAALWSARRAGWLRAEPCTGTIPGGAAAELLARLDATGLDDGARSAEIVVRANDPVRPTLRLPVELSVSAAADIDVRGGPLDFGSHYVGTAEQLYLLLFNRGFEPLHVDSIVADLPDYGVEPASLVAGPGESRLITVTFVPSVAGPRSGALTLESDDPDSPSVTVPLNGVGVEPPRIAFSPDLVDEELVNGQQTVRQLGVLNLGGDELVFDLLLRPELVVPPGSWSWLDDFEDGDLAGWHDAGGGGFKEVSDETAAAGSARSYTEYGSATPLAHYDGIYTHPGEPCPSYVTFWVRSGATTTHDAYVTLRDDRDRLVFYFLARGSGHLVLNPRSGGDASRTYEPETWYHVEIRSIDWEARSFDYYLDGELVAARVGFDDPEAASADRIDLYNLTRGSRAWWDEIRVLAEEPPAWIAVGARQGVVAPGGRHDVALRFDASGLPPGEVRAAIRVGSNDPERPQSLVPVLLRTREQPAAALAPEALEAALPPHAAFPAHRSVLVTNAGRGELVWEIETASHVDAVPAAGRLAPGESAEVAMSISSATLEPGDYSSLVALRSNDPAAPLLELPLTLHVREVALDYLHVGWRPRGPTPASSVEVTLQLPPEFDPREVLGPSVRLWDRLPPLPLPALLDDRNRDGHTDLTLHFDRAAFEELLPTDGVVFVEISGEIDSRAWFRGRVALRRADPQLFFPRSPLRESPLK